MKTSIRLGALTSVLPGLALSFAAVCEGFEMPPTNLSRFFIADFSVTGMLWIN